MESLIQRIVGISGSCLIHVPIGMMLPEFRARRCAIPSYKGLYVPRYVRLLQLHILPEYVNPKMRCGKNYGLAFRPIIIIIIFILFYYYYYYY